jgi:YD repeat-containing protein
VAFTSNVHYDYGEYGQRTLMQEKNGSTVIGSTSYAYSHATMRTRLTSETRVFNGLATGNPYKLDYSFNMEDDLTAVTYTAGAWSKTVNYGYNGIGAPTKIGTNLVSIGGLDTTNNVMRNLTFRAFGALKDADYGNQQRVELSYSADRLNLTRLKAYKSTPIPVNIIDKNYDYYNGGGHNGRLQKVTDALDGSFTTTYIYDERNRLSSANSGSVLTRSYGYDDWGNLTSATMGGTSNTLASYTLNYTANGTGAPATNRINTITEGVNHTVGHDSSGNLTSDNSTGATYTYDGAARLATATTATSTYEYDGDGRRVKQAASGASTFYLWSSVLGQPALELNSSGGVVRAYVFSSSGQRVALQASNGSFYWVHGDHLGSSHMLTDTSGNVAYRAEYDPHGNLRLETGTTTLTSRKFTGYERDAANLDFAQARTYGYRRG